MIASIIKKYKMLSFILQVAKRNAQNVTLVDLYKEQT